MKSAVWENLPSSEADDLVEGELIESPAAVVAACGLLAAAGVAPVCVRCHDQDEPIAAVLLFHADECRLAAVRAMLAPAAARGTGRLGLPSRPESEYAVRRWRGQALSTGPGRALESTPA